jgi:glycosyltransferase involved in cell wall biosynthesis
MDTPTDRAPLVTFAIPLRRPTSVADRQRLDTVLALTLGSIFRQSDGDFRVLIGASHWPELPDFVDHRLQVVSIAGYEAATWESANREGRERRWALARRFAELGGGYLMFVDYDDFVHRDLVAHVRANPHPNGYAAGDGYIYNAAENVLGPYPLPPVATGPFHEFCGSSLIVRLRPDEVYASESRGPSLFERTQRAGHHVVFDRMRDEGRPLGLLPFPAVAYTRNTGDNISRYSRSGDEARQEWLGRLDTALRANACKDDGALRDAFTIPERYPVLWTGRGKRFETDPRPVSLSVLICTHRRPGGLHRLLTALVPQAKAKPLREIIVVNDGTHDDHYAKVIASFAEAIRYHALEASVGIAQARNAAAKLATGDYLVFTDDDCESPAFWLDWLAARLTEQPELDVLAGTTRPLWPARPTFFARVRAVHNLIPQPMRAFGSILFPTANVAIRRSLFESLGGFGFPDFAGAGEDTELATRLSLRGAAIACDPAWFTRHEIVEGFFGLCRRYRRYGRANGRLIRLTTSPVAHDFKQEHWKAGWRTVWRGEMNERLAVAHAAHGRSIVARASAVLACLVKMAYWQGVREAITGDGD